MSASHAVVAAHRRHHPPGQVAKVVVRRYAVSVVVLVVAILLVNFVPSLRKTVSALAAPAPSHVTPAPTPGTPGTTVGGYHCGPGIRQVPWSHYAPYCMPAWHGNNGGATAPGVTATTITLTYREATSADLDELYDFVPEKVIGTNSWLISTEQAYINTFNKDYELYGRKVVLKPFVGKGDFVAEINGEDQAEAQEDAVTARSMGAFADSSVLDSTPEYTQALAQQQVIGLTIFGGPDSEFAQNAPYLYSSEEVCSKDTAETVQLVGRVLDKTPTSFAGDPTLNGQKRVFGFIGDSTAQSEECDADTIAALKATYGITMAAEDQILLGTSLQSEASVAIAKMKTSGVTTIICSSCDFFSPIFLTQAADANQYHPEWIESDFLDALTNLQAQKAPDQVAHAIAFGSQAAPATQTEAYQAFKLGASPGEQIIPSYAYVYEPLLEFFDALQQAGPDLTALSFQRGFRSIPRSIPGGMYGTWATTSDSFDPNASFSIVSWSNSTPSAMSGTPGAWVNCNGGQVYAFVGAPQLPLGQPLHCPSLS